MKSNGIGATSEIRKKDVGLREILIGEREC